MFLGLGQKSIFQKVKIAINGPAGFEATCLVTLLASPIQVKPNGFEKIEKPKQTLISGIISVALDLFGSCRLTSDTQNQET
jgi:hypothetical protein